MVQRSTKDMVCMAMTGSVACRVWRFMAGKSTVLRYMVAVALLTLVLRGLVT